MKNYVHKNAYTEKSIAMLLKQWELEIIQLSIKKNG